MGLPMASQELALDNLGPIEVRQPSMGHLSLSMDIQTQVGIEDRDLAWADQTALDNRALIGQRQPLEDTTCHPRGSQDRAQEEDKHPGMSSHLTARHLGTGHGPSSGSRTTGHGGASSSQASDSKGQSEDSGRQ